MLGRDVSRRHRACLSWALLLSPSGHPHLEERATAWSLEADCVTTVASGNAPHQIETETGALAIGGEGAERLEDALPHGFAHPGTPVGDTKAHPWSVSCRIDAHRTSRGMTPRIAEKVAHEVTDQVLFSLDHGRATGERSLEAGRLLGGECAKIDLVKTGRSLSISRRLPSRISSIS